jgi:DNA invertase Pin-like site-specific DNA recombinase
MASARPGLRRCAIYTRKSSTEELEQQFNSLAAQREACEAFVRSQQGEGWRLIQTPYDDGGLSGGTMARPGLQRLLADIAHDSVDVVVVYKVDRLTRALSDFAKMVELFDTHRVSFVAVTQQFNTTTSMGRLTLNVLLSFAQFEREVTGERIRDKIAAAKRKGLWMGGCPPLGYDVRERRLIVNPAEAATVKHIFERFLVLGSVRRLQEELARSDLRSKVRLNRDGTNAGGCCFSRGAVYKLLGNPIYVGEVPHRSLSHPGQHEAIIERRLWEQVRQRLREHTRRKAIGKSSLAAPALAGKLFAESDQRLVPTYTIKRGSRYRYYVSRDINGAAKATPGWRLPALALEHIVAAEVRQMLDDACAIASALHDCGIAPVQISSALQATEAWNRDPSSDGETLSVLERAELRTDGLRLCVSLQRFLAPNDHKALIVVPMLTRLVPLQLRRRGFELRLMIDNKRAVAAKPDPMLLALIGRARAWFEHIRSGEVKSTSELATRLGVHRRQVNYLLPLAFLSPDIVEIIIAGQQPAELTAQRLIKRVRLPLAWARQKRVLGMP